MQSSHEWWIEVKADRDKLMDWLRKQYHGEATLLDEFATFSIATVHRPTIPNGSKPWRKSLAKKNSMPYGSANYFVLAVKNPN